MPPLAGMEPKRPLDRTGAGLLTGFALILAFNQVVVKVTSDGFAPVFQAGLRSVGAFGLLLIWLWWRKERLSAPRDAWIWGIALGATFAAEFVGLFIALDLTSVSRASVLFYSMPVWLALIGHFLLPGERVTGQRLVGLALAMAGVGVALMYREGGSASLLGDAMALFATFAWAGIALLVRLTPLTKVDATSQLGFQLGVSAPILLLLSPLFGDLFREPEAVHWGGLAFQIIFVAFGCYLLWLRLMSVYLASAVASFSFLSPVLAVFFGWWVLDEQVGLPVWGALGLVVLGVTLINRPAR